MPTVFEWNARKEATNRARHGGGFEEAMTLFADPLGRSLDDPRHSHGESRFVLLGLSIHGRILAVMFTERGTDRVRIISGRRATRHERQDYEEGWP
jgi:uncharacterized DUF497 family protein